MTRNDAKIPNCNDFSTLANPVLQAWIETPGFWPVHFVDASKQAQAGDRADSASQAESRSECAGGSSPTSVIRTSGESTSAAVVRGSTKVLAEQHPTNLRSLPRPNRGPALAAQRAFTQQQCTEVLLRSYLQLVHSERSKPKMAMEESPKGVSSVFCNLCPSLEALDLHDRSKAVVHVFCYLSPTITKFAWLIIAPLLWLVRFIYLRGSPFSAILLALTSFGAMLIAEQVAIAQATANPSSTGSTSSTTTAAVTANGPALPPKQRKHALLVFAAQSLNKMMPTSGSGTRASLGNPTSKTKEDPQMKAVRAAVINLELVLYGNELTEGLLPADVLPLRVAKLCEDIGVPLEKGANAAQMMAALKEVEKNVGVGR